MSQKNLSLQQSTSVQIRNTYKPTNKGVLDLSTSQAVSINSRRLYGTVIINRTIATVQNFKLNNE
jgi:hypothetical protein